MLNDHSEYMDESQLETPKENVKWKIFKFSNEEEKKEAEALAKQFKAENPTWSDVGHTDKCFYVGYCKAGQLAVESVLEAGKYYKLNVDLTAGYMLGNNWATCH